MYVLSTWFVSQQMYIHAHICTLIVVYMCRICIYMDMYVCTILSVYTSVIRCTVVLIRYICVTTHMCTDASPWHWSYEIRHVRARQHTLFINIRTNVCPYVPTLSYVCTLLYNGVCTRMHVYTYCHACRRMRTHAFTHSFMYVHAYTYVCISSYI